MSKTSIITFKDSNNPDAIIQTFVELNSQTNGQNRSNQRGIMELSSFNRDQELSGCKNVSVFQSLGMAQADLNDELKDKLLSRNSNVLEIEPSVSFDLPKIQRNIPQDRSKNLPDILKKIETDIYSRIQQIDRLFGTTTTHNRLSRLNPSSAISWALESIGIGSDTELTGKGVGLCIVDTGVDASHPDLIGRINPQDAYNFASQDSNDLTDSHGHGTHCGGIAGGCFEPSEGPRYSVAPDCRLLSANVFGSEINASTEDILSAMEWALTRGAKVISMSLGSTRNKGQSPPNYYEKMASRMLDYGTLVVAAAGNDSRRELNYTAPVNIPAACPSIISVGAINQHHQVCDFSCGEVDTIGLLNFSAPGHNIRSSTPGGSYDNWNGTSMACPHIAGLLALLMEAYPTATANDVWELLKQQSTQLGNTQDYGQGLPNLSSLLSILQPHYYTPNNI